MKSPFDPYACTCTYQLYAFRNVQIYQCDCGTLAAALKCVKIHNCVHFRPIVHVVMIIQCTCTGTTTSDLHHIPVHECLNILDDMTLPLHIVAYPNI